MEGKLLKVCVILWRCWTLAIVLEDHFPSSMSLLQFASPISPTTPPYSFWLQKSLLTNNTGLQQFLLATNTELQQSLLTTNTGLQQFSLATNTGLQQSSLTTSPVLQQSPLTTSPGLQQSPLTPSPGLQQSPLTTSPGLQQSPLTTSPGLQQSPLTTSTGPPRSPSQHPPLVPTRDVSLTANTPMGETQSSVQNHLQPIVSHLHPDINYLRRKKRKDCFSEGVRVTNESKEVLKTYQESDTLFFYPEDDFENIHIILSLGNRVQGVVVNKDELCVNNARRWYTLAFNTCVNHSWFIRWGIKVKVKHCSSNCLPIDYLYLFNWYSHMRVEATGSSYWSTTAPDPDCLNPLADHHTTAGGELGTPVLTHPTTADHTTAEEPGTPVSKHPSTADHTTAGEEPGTPVLTQIIFPALVMTIVLCVALVIFVIFLRRRRDRSSSGHPPVSPAAEFPESPIYENVIRLSGHSPASNADPEGSPENQIYENINLRELRGSRGSPHDSENSVYGSVCQPTAAPGERVSAHDSENSVYGAVCQPTAAPGERVSAHDSENSVYGAVC